MKMKRVEKILVSACLLGKRVRYDGNTLTVLDQIIQDWQAEGRIVPVCPEVDGGMNTPRPPAEITHGGGYRVLDGTAKVIDVEGTDVTNYFEEGASIALSLCKKHGIKVAILSESSPSCGSTTIYDGTFTGEKIQGEGVTAALLKENGIQVFSQHSIEAAAQTILKLSQS